MAVEWTQAQRRSVRHWRRIHQGIGRRDPLAIVSEVNELGALCEMARQEAGGEAERCAYCVVFADAAQCAEARLDITELLLDGETERARAATLAVVERIAAAEAPGLD